MKLTIRHVDALTYCRDLGSLGPSTTHGHALKRELRELAEADLVYLSPTHRDYRLTHRGKAALTEEEARRKLPMRGRPPLGPQERRRRREQGEYLRLARVAAGHTQTALAAIAKVDRSVISRTELGEKPLDDRLKAWLGTQPLPY